MSHVARVDLTIADLDALDLELTEGFAGQARRVRDAGEHQYYAGAKTACAHKMVVEGTRYELGLVARGDGKGFQVQYDPWDGSADRLFGRGLSKLKDQYGARVTERRLTREGYDVRRSYNDAGKLQVRAFAR